jgi:hypothetical protein
MERERAALSRWRLPRSTTRPSKSAI